MKCDRFASMLLILCMVLAGCTGPAAPEEGATAAEQPAPEAPAAEEAEPLTMLVFPPDDVALYAEAFTEQTQVEIEFAEPSNAAFEQMLTDFAAGKSTYDIVGVDNALGSLYTMDSLLDQGYFLPLTDAPNVGEAVGQMLPVLQELVTREGTVYALPHFVRFKLLEYNGPLYQAVAEGQLAQYNRSYYPPVTKTQAENLPPQEEFASWRRCFRPAIWTRGAETCLQRHAGAVHTERGRGRLHLRFAGIRARAGTHEGRQDCRRPSARRCVGTRHRRRCDLSRRGGDRRLQRLLSAADAGRAGAHPHGLRRAGGERLYRSDGGRPALPGYRRRHCAERHRGRRHLQLRHAGNRRLLHGRSAHRRQRRAGSGEPGALAGDAGESRPHHGRGVPDLLPLELFPQYLDGAITAEQCAAQTQERYQMYKLEQGE